MKTYCNPLPLPNYPRGVLCRPERKDRPDFTKLPPLARRDWREMADPTVVHDEANARWILYPSGHMAYVSTDLVEWRHHPIEPAATGYAPTVAKIAGRWWLTACHAPMFIADDPLGPFKEAGSVTRPDGSALPREMSWADPMLFADDDGRAYAYWGIRTGIFGAELDLARPGRLLTEPVCFIRYDRRNAWERGGVFGQHDTSCTEGAWLHKHADRYWLLYSAPGSNPTYSMGGYVADSPLGPFRYAARNPVLDGRSRCRFVRGAGHGCVVAGPGGNHWVFYTCHVMIHHGFERRIGMDPLGVDADGNLYCPGPSDTPQRAPGAVVDPAAGNDTGWQPVSFGESARASSHVYGREPAFALDLNPQTWWEARVDDALPWFEIDLYTPQALRAIRLHWKEPGLDFDGGAGPLPMRWRLLGRSEAGVAWTCLIDRAQNGEDWLIEYHELPEGTPLRHVRLELTEAPGAVGVGLIDFTLFAEIRSPE